MRLQLMKFKHSDIIAASIHEVLDYVDSQQQMLSGIPDDDDDNTLGITTPLLIGTDHASVGSAVKSKSPILLAHIFLHALPGLQDHETLGTIIKNINRRLHAMLGKNIGLTLDDKVSWLFVFPEKSMTTMGIHR